ncbi:hypothetical protein RHMOL_Rhmol03G0214100 [Rhododendron molle]|uniref:Uncharacterized protein n=1 Tax=Rhododendron molle TaxID=49168 RepID=A0ACC0PGP9_RHOML|nr:hypothetical protein RHMOL_Rhmol03G0214100 [Rhododendron molle]
MSSSNRDWAWLPINLLYSVAEKIVKFSDYKHFSAVCQRWRHHALQLATDDYKQRLHILKTCHNKLPMLMIDTKENRESDERCLFSVTEGITYRVQLPLPCNKRFLGSSFGWLFTVEEKTMVIILLNPFTGGVIPLPPLKDPHGHYEDYIDDYPEHFVSKVVLSSDPFLSPNNYEVVVIYEGMHRLAILESGKDSWNFVDRAPFVYSDVIYYPEGQGRGLYAVNYWRELVKIDLASSTKEVLTKKTAANAQVTYLVQSQEGDLLLVERFWLKPDCDIWKTWRFMVFQLLHSIGETEAATWVPIKSLGSQALFLGDNHSVCVSTSEFPECLPNCIYYTAQHHIDIPPYVCQGIDEDSGIFNLEEGSFQSHYLSDPFNMNFLPPIWFVPNMKGT